METKILLVVDDSSIITSFVNKIFKDEFNVISAKDGVEAIEVIRNNFDKEFIVELFNNSYTFIRYSYIVEGRKIDRKNKVNT